MISSGSCHMYVERGCLVAMGMMVGWWLWRRQSILIPSLLSNSVDTYTQKATFILFQNSTNSHETCCQKDIARFRTLEYP